MNLSHISDLFWSEYVWLPPGVTWKTLEPTPERPYANFNHLYLPILGAAVILCLRFIFERLVFRPWGLWMGIKARKAKLDPEVHAAVTAGPAGLQSLAKKRELSERQIDRLVRRYQALRKPEKLAKFCETSWRWFFYTSMTLYGAWVLYDKPWTWNVLNCWLGFPKHYMTPDVWWYYMIELSFYWALMVSQFFDVKRKDFTQMFVHHCATIMLLSFSWACNLTRVGTLVLIVHDIADIFLEGAKMAKYAGKLTLCNFLFAVFTVVWIISRLGIFPFKIIYSIFTEGRDICTFYPAYVFLMCLLIGLLCLHVYWTKFILVQIVVALRSRGEMEKDVRSSSEAELTEEMEEEEERKKNPKKGATSASNDMIGKQKKKE